MSEEGEYYNDLRMEIGCGRRTLAKENLPKVEVEIEGICKIRDGKIPADCQNEFMRLKEKLWKIVDRYWSFTQSQQHTHSWHDKQDCREEFMKG